jgi:CRP/FNR family cyclic AMP-dependent transcriptional regulator
LPTVLSRQFRGYQELRARVAAAIRDGRKKDEFLAVLAHELRNPLSAIRNAVSVLELSRGEEEPTTTIRAREVIARQVGHLSRLTDDLLDVERAVFGKIVLNRQPLDISDVVRRAVDAFTEDRRGDRHVDVRVESVWVDADAGRLEQVVTNLMNNAVKYTPAGGWIEVALRADGDEAVLTVEDTGAGISPKLLPQIFDMFVQAPRTFDRAQGGLGIGLTLVRRLVEAHGGTVVASSEGEARGSKFTVRLPQSAATGKSARRRMTAHEDLQPRSTDPKGRAVLMKSAKAGAFDAQAFLESAGVAKKIVEYRRGDVIFTQGDPCEHVLYIQTGGVKLSVLSKSGRQAVVAMLGPGEFFGEGGLAGQPVRMGSAAATTASTVLLVEKDQMVRLLHEQHAMSDRFIAHMLARNIQIEEDLIDQLFNSSEKRLARTLLLLARYGKHDRPVRSVPPISQETLAEMVGTTRSRVNFFMKKFQRLGFIDYTDGLKVNNSLLTVVLHD